MLADRLSIFSCSSSSTPSMLNCSIVSSMRCSDSDDTRSVTSVRSSSIAFLPPVAMVSLTRPHISRASFDALVIALMSSSSPFTSFAAVTMSSSSPANVPTVDAASDATPTILPSKLASGCNWLNSSAAFSAAS